MVLNVIDEDEELCYIDDGTPMEILEKNPSSLEPVETQINLVPDVGQGLGQILNDPIDLGLSEVEKPVDTRSRSPPLTFEEVEKHVEKTTEGDATLDSKSDDDLLLEKAGTLLWFTFFSDLFDRPC
jgi:hypothetical protein